AAAQIFEEAQKVQKTKVEPVGALRPVLCARSPIRQALAGSLLSDQLAFRCRAAERLGFRLVRRCGVRRRAEDPWCLPDARAFRLCLSASIRLMTLLGRSSGSATLTGLPAALRRTRFFSACS